MVRKRFSPITLTIRSTCSIYGRASRLLQTLRNKSSYSDQIVWDPHVDVARVRSSVVPDAPHRIANIITRNRNGYGKRTLNLRSSIATRRSYFSEIFHVAKLAGRPTGSRHCLFAWFLPMVRRPRPLRRPINDRWGNLSLSLSCLLDLLPLLDERQKMIVGILQQENCPDRSLCIYLVYFLRM